MASHSNNLNVGMRCIKYMLFVINFMFVLTGFLIISVGATIQAIYGEFSHFLDSNFMSPPALMVAIGIILLVVSAFGCVGAIRESTMLINIYGVLLAFIFILEISAAIAAFALRGQVEEMLQRTMTNAIQQYPEDQYVAASVDFMQEALQCCGVNGREDWGIIEDQPGLDSEFNLPPSCYNCTVSTPEQYCASFVNGCFNRMEFIVIRSATLIATGALTVAFVQFLGVICAFMLAKTIRRTKSQRLARRWQLQHSLGIVGKPMTNPHNPPYVQLSSNNETTKPNNNQDFTYLPSSPSVN